MVKQPDPNRGGEGLVPVVDGKLNIASFVPDVVSPVTAAANDALGVLRQSLDNPGAIDAVVEGFVSRVSMLEADGDSNRDGATIFLKACASAAAILIDAGYVRQAARVAASTDGPEGITVMIAALVAHVKKFHASSGVEAWEFEDLVLSELDARSPAAVIALLRYTRHRIIVADDNLTPLRLLVVDGRLKERLGVDYDPLDDWLATEELSAPLADWQAIGAVVRDNDLWPPEVPLHVRLTACQDTGDFINEVLAGGELEKGFGKVVAEQISSANLLLGEAPARSYLNAMLALALYQHGSLQYARRFMNSVSAPEAAAYLAEGLLRLSKPMVAEAQRVILDITDRRVVVDTLLDGSWPDAAVTRGFIEEIITLQTKRVGGGQGPFPSTYPIAFRTEFMRALANRYEQQGDAGQADVLRSRASQLEWQLRNSVVKYMPRRQG